MPVYMDTHKGSAELPAELRKTVTERIRNGNKDEFGVIDRGIIIDREGQEMHCVLDAPNVDAVMKHHAAINVPLEHESVHQADVIFKS